MKSINAKDELGSDFLIMLHWAQKLMDAAEIQVWKAFQLGAGSSFHVRGTKVFPISFFEI